MDAYVTYFDSGYLSRGLALIESIRKFDDFAMIYVLCLDEKTKNFLDEQANLRVQTLSFDQLQTFEPRLMQVLESRSRIEMYFTCTPIVLQLVAKLEPQLNHVIYVDADIYFFYPPINVLQELGDGSVGIIEHRYPPRLQEKLKEYGTFNVGWVGFKLSEQGLAVLNWWAENCIVWCHDFVEDGKFADQGYLDDFVSFPGVRVLTNPGFNVAPWNSEQYSFCATRKDEAPLISERDPVVFYHFHGLRSYGMWWILGENHYGAKVTKSLRELIYKPYTLSLDKAEHSLQESGVLLTSEKIDRFHSKNAIKRWAVRTKEFARALMHGGTLAKNICRR